MINRFTYRLGSTRLVVGIWLLGLLFPISAYSLTEAEVRTIIQDNLPALASFDSASRTALRNIAQTGEMAVPVIAEMIDTMIAREQELVVLAKSRTPVSLTPEEMAEANTLGTQQLHFVNLLGTSSSPDAIAPLIAVARSSDPRARNHQNIFRALAGHGPNSTILNYALEVLDDAESGELELRSALAYIADEENPAHKPYAQKYLQSGYSKKVRDMAAYLAGKLNATELKPAIQAYLDSPEDARWKLYAAFGMAHMTTIVEFATIVQNLELSSNEGEVASQYAKFISETDTEKEALTHDLVGSGFSPPITLALNWMLENNRIDLLEQNKLLMGETERVELYQLQANGDITAPLIKFLVPTPYNRIALRLGYQLGGDASVPVFSR